MAHGYWKDGKFIETETKAEAVDKWRKEHGYSTGGVYDMGGGEVVDTRKGSKKSAPATPRAASSTSTTETSVERNARLQAAFNQRSWSTPLVPSTSSRVEATSGWGPTSTPTTYDVQSVQSQGAPTQRQSKATPAEQAAARGGGVPEQVLPYFADIGSGTQYLWSQYPQNVGAVGTPTEQRYGQKDLAGSYAGYGPTSYQWSESPASLAEMAHGRTPVGPALAAADTVAAFLTEFGVRPSFITPFVQQALGLTTADMGPDGLGMVQDLYGQWIALDFGDDALTDSGVGYGSYAGGGYAGVGGYSSPANFRSGYTSGLINWRIGL